MKLRLTFIIILLFLTVYVVHSSLFDLDFFQYGFLGPKNFIKGNPEPDLTEVFNGRYKRIILAFIWPDENGNLQQYPNTRTDIVVPLKQKGIEVSVSIGGAGTSYGFPSLSDSSKLINFLNSLAIFSDTIGIINANLSWEFADEKDSSTYISLVRGLTQVFNKVTITVPYGKYYGKYIPDLVFEMVNKVLVMTYYQSGLWDSHARHINALYSAGEDLSIAASMNYWIQERSIAPDKILLGLLYHGFAYYGISNLRDPLQENPSGRRGDSVPNFEIKKRWDHLPTEWDSIGQVPYIKVPSGNGSEDTLVVFDNYISYDFKIAFAESLGLAGVFYWQIGQEVKSLSKVKNVESKSISIPYYLYQNYPNPFNSSTIISYQLPKSTHVEIKIYNTIGQEIKTLVSEKQNAGNYQIIWNGKDSLKEKVCTGIYLYQIRTNEFVAINKMVMIQ